MPYLVRGALALDAGWPVGAERGDLLLACQPVEERMVESLGETEAEGWLVLQHALDEVKQLLVLLGVGAEVTLKQNARSERKSEN